MKKIVFGLPQLALLAGGIPCMGIIDFLVWDLRHVEFGVK